MTAREWFEQFADPETGVIEMTAERQADFLRAATGLAADGESRANLRQAARDLNATAADPSLPSKPIPYLRLR